MNIALIFDKYFNNNKNVFTTKIYGYSKTHLIGDNYLLFEKSENNVLFDHITYGVTVLIHNTRNKATQQVDLSTLFTTKSEVEEFIKSIDLDKALDSKVIGELKHLT